VCLKDKYTSFFALDLNASRETKKMGYGLESRWIVWLMLFAGTIIIGFLIGYVYRRQLFCRENNRRWRILFGVMLVMLGIAGIFLPIIPGLLFIFLGLSMLRLFFLKRLVRKIVGKNGQKNQAIQGNLKKIYKSGR
jgi:hypothetical protein